MEFSSCFFFVSSIIIILIVSLTVRIEEKQFIKAFVATVITFVIIRMIVNVKIGRSFIHVSPIVLYFTLLLALEILTYNLVKSFIGRTKEEKKKEFILLKNTIIIYIFIYIVVFTTNVPLGIIVLTVGLIILLIKTETKLTYLILTSPLLFILINYFYPNDTLGLGITYGFGEKDLDNFAGPAPGFAALAIIFYSIGYVILLYIAEVILFLIMKMIKKYKKKKGKEEIIIKKEEKITKKGELQKFIWQ